MSRPLPRYLIAAEAAQVLRTDIWQVARLCRAGQIRASKKNGKWLIAEADLVAYIESEGDAA